MSDVGYVSDFDIEVFEIVGFVICGGILALFVSLLRTAKQRMERSEVETALLIEAQAAARQPLDRMRETSNGA